jgi:membrane associated rhomboid family serine protease
MKGIGRNFLHRCHDKNDGPEEGVGYAAHIGGMLGGALFFCIAYLSCNGFKLSR